MVVSCPAILAEKPLELQRKVDFLKQVRQQTACMNGCVYD